MCMDSSKRFMLAGRPVMTTQQFSFLHKTQSHRMMETSLHLISRSYGCATVEHNGNQSNFDVSQKNDVELHLKSACMLTVLLDM